MSGHDRPATDRRVAGIDRADAVLLAIPLAFCAVYAVGSVLAAAEPVALAGASVAAGILVVDGLFWHPPNEA